MLPSEFSYQMALKHCVAGVITATADPDAKQPIWGFKPNKKTYAVRYLNEVHEGCRDYVKIKQNECLEEIQKAKKEVSKKKKKPMSKKRVPPGFPYQLPTQNELTETYEDFKDEAWKELTITPRWHQLVIGRTGTGKTHLARFLSDSQETPLLTLTTSTWIIRCGHTGGGNRTWPDIIKFIKENERGIIFLDEIDKTDDRSPYTIAVKIETFLLLDGEIPTGSNHVTKNKEGFEVDHELTSEESYAISKKLKENFLIIAAGAFQDTMESLKKSKVGFQESDANEPVPNHDELAKVLPRELVNRFARIHCLPYPGKEDYQAMITQTAKTLPEAILPHFVEAANKLLPSAEANQMGARFAEIALAKALNKERKTRPPAPPKPPSPKKKAEPKKSNSMRERR